MKNSWPVFCLLAMLAACEPGGPQTIRVDARPSLPAEIPQPGLRPLDLGGYRLVNRSVIWRDGYIYLPQAVTDGTPLPLLIWLHGGGGEAESFDYAYPIAEQHNIVVLALDARHNTWDGIDSPYGPDVVFIDKALEKIFQTVAIDADRIALGGLSDGGAYALAVGRVNGDLFTHLIAVAPGFLTPPGEPVGKPRVYVAHGLRDRVYGVSMSRNYTVPQLRRHGYQVDYLEFDGPHWATAPVIHRVMEWLSRSQTAPSALNPEDRNIG